MTESKRPPLAGLAYAGVGFSFAAIVGTMAVLGYLGDRWLGTEPWLLTVGAMVGVTIAVMDLIRTVSALGRRKKGTDG